MISASVRVPDVLLREAGGGGPPPSTEILSATLGDSVFTFGQVDIYVTGGATGAYYSRDGAAPVWVPLSGGKSRCSITDSGGGAAVPVEIWAGTNADTSVNGKISQIHTVGSNQGWITIDASECTAVDTFSFPYTPTLTSVNVSGNPIGSFTVNSNPNLATLDTTGCSSFTIVQLWGSPLITSFDSGSSASLSLINVGGCTGLTSLSLLNCPLLNYIEITGTGLTSLDLSEMSLVGEYIYIHNNSSLATLIVPTGFEMTDHTSTSYRTLDITNNALTSGALDDIYIAVADVTAYSYSHIIQVGGNAGAAGSNPSLCTTSPNKNWIVVGAP